MRTSLFFLLRFLTVTLLLLGCVNPEVPDVNATVNVIVVDGSVTDRAEPQIVRLNRSKADPKTGRFGSLPLTDLSVELVVDSGQVVAFHETFPGTYQLPGGFQGRVGHRYQLRFRLPDDTRYESSTETLRAAPPIGQVTARFNPLSLQTRLLDGFTAAHDFYLTTQDPAETRNFYRWDWVLWEKQEWCRSCYQSVYAVNTILPHQYHYDDMNGQYFVSGKGLFEDCFTPLQRPKDFSSEVIGRYVRGGNYFYDYRCRTQCWEILFNYGFNLFDDRYINGASLVDKQVAQIPFFTRTPALVEIRQLALSQEAYQFYKLVQDQTENNGGLADTPPVAPIGNVHNVVKPRERVVGYFAATGVATLRYWLDRKDASGPSVGSRDMLNPPIQSEEELFVALNQRRPSPEPPPPYGGNRFPPSILIWGGPPRVPAAVCVPSASRTPVRPEGWRD